MLRKLVVIVSVLIWAFFVYIIGSDQIGIQHAESTSHSAWAMSTLLVIFVLFIFHALVHLLAKELDFLALLLNTVLFVSSGTVLTSLGVALATGAHFEPWILPTVSVGNLLMIAVIMGQIVSLDRARKHVDRYVEEVVMMHVSQMTIPEKLALVAVARRIAPLDFHPGGMTSRIAGHPDAWEILANLFELNRIPWDQSAIDRVRGVKALGWIEKIYFSFGLVGAWVGSLTVLLGVAALGGVAA